MHFSSRPQLKENIRQCLVDGGMILRLISQVFSDFQQEEKHRIFKPDHILNALAFLYKQCYPSQGFFYLIIKKSKALPIAKINFNDETFAP